MIKHLVNYRSIATGIAACILIISSAFTLATTPEQVSLIERHLVTLEGGRNFRDLGGYTTTDGRTVKSGHLFRSGVLHNLTSADYAELSQYDIQTIVDLRATDEREREPTHWQAGEIQMLNWDYDMMSDADESALAPFADPSLDSAGAEALMGLMYRDMIEQQRPHYAALFQELAESGEPLLFHCSAGKDRTGIAAALVLSALGVDQETIIRDYTLSEVILQMDSQQILMASLEEQDLPESYSMLANMSPAALDALMGTRASYLESAMDEMTRAYGSVDAYITDGLGMSAADIERIRAHYLE